MESACGLVHTFCYLIDREVNIQSGDVNEIPEVTEYTLELFHVLRRHG